MSTGTIIAIAIVVVSLVALIVIGLMSYSKVKSTVEKMNDLNETINQKKEFYTRESQHINERVNSLTQRVEGIQSEVDVKMMHFEDFMDEKGQFQSSIRYLQSHAGDYAKGISGNVRDEIKEDGPKIKETFKRAFKETA